MNIEEFIEGFSFNACDNADRVIYAGHLRVFMEGKVLVPVELLHAIEIDLSMECTNFDTLNKLRAIIEDKP